MHYSIHRSIVSNSTRPNVLLSLPKGQGSCRLPKSTTNSACTAPPPSPRPSVYHTSAPPSLLLSSERRPPRWTCTPASPFAERGAENVLKRVFNGGMVVEICNMQKEEEKEKDGV
ncbi:hypothetical protein BU26DRAFT_294469 [Trematosphaeria pertusa]|uniref:Uncharacterized protein n=1 Tax=Trematosphaeria pertusa TaxID=390896 RepID=A0A6A6IKL2_9PLEO|nr:uncharacterized protein BU26DRAFT_294469 [Trematosphaeria pertusa]KAF2250023.1 hypothetical protein BU26DRAFT_294469 [Trematosphaeria pertusa]